MDATVLTVNELNLLIKDNLEKQFFYCVVEGEISNLIMAQSGHIYFSLKDDLSVIKVVIWRNSAMTFLPLLKNGNKVEIYAKLTVYAPRGEYQLVANRVQPFGVGALFVKYEALKETLRLEGLFDEAHKQAIPLHPQQIGIITSENAAAYQDVLKVLSEHRPDIPIKIYPTKVQGQSAAQEIVNAISKANQEKCVSLILLVRGGGSIEDLWSFNEESVARAIYHSSIPIITGIGHETDITIADYVADRRAATPSMAAKLSSISMEELRPFLDRSEFHLYTLINEKLKCLDTRINMSQEKLLRLDPKANIYQSRVELEKNKERLNNRIRSIIMHYESTLSMLNAKYSETLIAQKIIRIKHQLEKKEQELIANIHRQGEHYRKKISEKALHLDQLSPLKTLSRGYALVQNTDQSLIKTIADINKGDPLHIKLHDGDIEATVLSTTVTTSDD